MSDRKLRRKFGKRININQENETDLTTEGQSNHPEGDEDASQLTSILKDDSSENEMKLDDFERLQEIGWGSSGVVYKVVYKPTGQVMAQKVTNDLIDNSTFGEEIHVDPNNARIASFEEMPLMYIVSYYGAFQNQCEIYMLMEYMEYGSLDKIFKAVKRIPETNLGKIIHDVLQGLSYLRSQQKVIHRGEVKICDFGVSGMLIDSIANTFVGTRSYMAPERLQGNKYTVRSDIWSIGVLMVELLTGRYPYPIIPMAKLKQILQQDPNSQLANRPSSQDEEIAIFELLDYIVNDEPPKLIEPYFEKETVDFVSKCLVKNPAERADLATLLEHEYIMKNKERDIKDWLKLICEPTN
ncbi:Dual specificity mitogen-activated protein kinase kinase 1 [Thelohanellus kitauei]|uniref:Dual specificity mitogen-activated protein kinase kinase 1 n=1 Tax=Thelohanellus kitauei TaxID=669202 RepID=A0A0C2MWA2_THEKT|nr:Dual specificity mitogen-activated protein kinase kinase 1 [Thelohanellus kitauei]